MSKTPLDFVDNLGETVTADVSDPEIAIVEECPSIAERPSAPVDQLVNRDTPPDYADFFPPPRDPVIVVPTPEGVASQTLGGLILGGSSLL